MEMGIKLGISLVIMFASLSLFAFDEVNLNLNGFARQQFINEASIKDEINQVLALSEEGQQYKLLYFVSFENILPSGLPPGRFVANEHKMTFKREDGPFYCWVRANIVWEYIEGDPHLNTDYSEPAQAFHCYEIGF